MPSNLDPCFLFLPCSPPPLNPFPSVTLTGLGALLFLSGTSSGGGAPAAAKWWLRGRVDERGSRRLFTRRGEVRGGWREDVDDERRREGGEGEPPSA